MYNLYNRIMSFIKKNLASFPAAIFMFLLPLISFADGETCEPGKICNPLAGKGIGTVQDFIRVLLEGVLKIGIPVVALAIIYCGFLFVTAVGNSEKIKKAREALIYTLIGAAILLGSWAIAKLIAETVTSLS